MSEIAKIKDEIKLLTNLRDGIGEDIGNNYYITDAKGNSVPHPLIAQYIGLGERLLELQERLESREKFSL